MKLLIVSQVPNSRLMGVPRVIHCIGDVLKARGHQVDYFFEEDGPKPWFPKFSLLEWSVRVAPQIAARCRKEKYDAIVITTFSGWALSTFRNILLPEGVKIISWHHGWEELMWQQMLLEEQSGGHRFSARFKFYYGGLILWALRQSLKTQDAALFTSTEERDWVRQTHPYFGARAFYQPNGVSDRYFYPERFSVEAQPETPVKLLFVGYWDPWRKGKKYLVEAFAQLHTRYPDLTLTLAGTKLSEADILPEFPEACRAAITVVPSADEAELEALYNGHDIFVLPSLFEGQPLVVLEAMAAGLPVVTSDSNGMRDLITHDETGLLVPRRDTEALTAALIRLIDSPHLRHQLGQAGQTFISRHHRWEHVALKFEQTLQQIIGHSTHA